LETTKQKVSVLESALTEKDKSIDELIKTNRQNVADLTDRLHRTENDLAETKGELIRSDAEVVRQTAMIQFMLTNGRKKCSLAIICLP
jgi:hypothetical protein